MTVVARSNPQRCPPHPGEVVEDILAGRKPVSPQAAARMGKLFGNGAGLWLRLQAAFDAWHADNEVDLSDVPVLKRDKPTKFMEVRY